MSKVHQAEVSAAIAAAEVSAAIAADNEPMTVAVAADVPIEKTTTTVCHETLKTSDYYTYCKLKSQHIELFVTTINVLDADDHIPLQYALQNLQYADQYANRNIYIILDYVQMCGAVLRPDLIKPVKCDFIQTLIEPIYRLLVEVMKAYHDKRYTPEVFYNFIEILCNFVKGHHIKYTDFIIEDYLYILGHYEAAPKRYRINVKSAAVVTGVNNDAITECVRDGIKTLIAKRFLSPHRSIIMLIHFETDHETVTLPVNTSERQIIQIVHTLINVFIKEFFYQWLKNNPNTTFKEHQDQLLSFRRYFMKIAYSHYGDVDTFLNQKYKYNKELYVYTTDAIDQLIYDLYEIDSHSINQLDSHSIHQLIYNLKAANL